MTSELAACQLLPDRHTLESPTCAAIWDAKQSEYQTCLKNQAGTYNGGIYTGPRATCDANFKAALTAAGYYTCVGSSYPGCRKSAFVKYKACQDSYDVCIYNEYSTLTDPALKAVALMNVANMTAQPVSLKTKMGSTELSSTSVQYKIFNSVPLQEIVSESLNGGTARQMLTITKYDAKANPTEVTDHKANMNKSYIWGYDNKLLIAEFQNALLADVAHTSFENTSNEGSLTFTLTPDLSAKTGTKGHKLVGKPVRRIGLTASKKYIVSYWAKAGTPVLTTVPANASRVDSDGIQESSGWKYYEKLITGATEIEINTTDAAVIDEVRIAPENVVITTFTHQLGVGLSSKMDANGQVTSFDYESTGKLETVKDHDGNILRHLIYQYKQ
jgi:hypothetical protein